MHIIWSARGSYTYSSTIFILIRYSICFHIFFFVILTIFDSRITLKAKLRKLGHQYFSYFYLGGFS